MPLTKAICTNCGAALEVDKTKDAAICPYCSTPYIVEKAINNYTINCDKLTIDTDSIEKELDRADVYLYKLNDSEKALEIYANISDRHPGDYRGWWGQANCITECFESLFYDDQKLSYLQKCVNNAISVAPDSKSDELCKIWNKYISFEDEYSNCLEKIDELTGENENKSETIQERKSNWKIKKAIRYLLIFAASFFFIALISADFDEAYYGLFMGLFVIPPIVVALILTLVKRTIIHNINREIEENKKSIEYYKNRAAALQSQIQKKK